MDTKASSVIAIGYAKRALEPGTRERVRMLQYAALLQQHHVIVFTKRSEGFPERQQDGNLYLYATNARTRLGMLWRAYRIGRTIVKQHDERFVVTSQDPFETSVVGRAVASGNRATHHVQIHGDVFNPRSYQGSLLERVRVIYGRFVVRHTKCLRVVSERIKHSLVLLGVPASAITVLPIHADLDTFFAVGKQRTHVVDDHLSFLYVGRFSPEKNLPLLINSFAEVALTYSTATLTLLGSGPLRSELESMVIKKNLTARIRFQDWSDDVGAVMAKHDVFCLASDHEGWGMVLLEAAAAGMPIITTDVGCAGECVRNDENGQVVLVGDSRRYVAAMERYLAEPGLVAVHGERSFKLAQSLALSSEVYIQRLVDALTSCNE